MATNKDSFEELINAIKGYDMAGAKRAAKRAVDEKRDLPKGIDEMSDALRVLGEQFHSGEIFVPHLVMASDAMIAALEVFKENIPKQVFLATRSGTIVLGTVEGDMHDIGLNLVGMTLISDGFEVLNLGKDVSVDRLIEKAIEADADIIGASSLLSVTMPKQKELVEEVKRRKLPFKVMVGGGPVTKEWAEDIGADGYGQDPYEALACAKELLES